MKSRVLINDTAEATFTRKSDGHKVLMHESQLASLSQTVSEEKLKGGIGNKTIALLRTDKEMELSVRNALWDAEYLAMTQGTKFKNGTVTITGKRTGTVGAFSVDSYAITLDKTTTAEKAHIVLPDGTAINIDKEEEGTVSGTAVTLKVASEGEFGLAEGQKVEVFVDEEVTGEVAAFDASKFGEKYKAEYKTIAYDPDTMQVVQDIYIIFDEVIPSGNFDMSFENGTAMTPEINFTVTNPRGSSELGRIIRVDRPVEE